MRVLVIGNSVALYVRPQAPGASTYAWRLRELLGAAGTPVTLDIWAENSLTATELAAQLEDRIVAFAPTVVILNVGIVECTPRILPQAWRRRFVRGRTSWERLWLAAEALVRRPLVATIGGVPPLSPGRFREAVLRLITVAHGEAGAQVLCLGIPPTTHRVEDVVPGIQEHIRVFDAEIRRACEAGGAEYVDPRPVLDMHGQDQALPDGIHFSALGHRALGEELFQRVTIRGSENVSAPASPASSKHPRAVSPWVRGIAVLPALILALFAAVWVPTVRLIRTLRGR